MTVSKDMCLSYTLKKQVPSVRDYIGIRIEAGLSRKSEEAACIGLSNSLLSVIAFHGDQPVGIGRVIGDGGCFLRLLILRSSLRIRKKALET